MTTTLESLAVLWARKYVEATATAPVNAVPQNPEDARVAMAAKLRESLPFALARGLSYAEDMLLEEIHQQGVAREHIDVWQISEDGRALFNVMIDAIANGDKPERLSATGSAIFGKIRERYTAQDGRVLGFVSLFMHSTAQLLTEHLSALEISSTAPFLKVVDDHLYMPIYALQLAAAEYDFNDPVLQTVRAVLPRISQIANQACDDVLAQFPVWQTHSGELADPVVRRSSVRDAEMFVVYMLLCLLQQSDQVIQRELFPLCVMLYPRLKVKWDLVRAMLISMEISLARLFPNGSLLTPHLATLKAIFGEAVLT